MSTSVLEMPRVRKQIVVQKQSSRKVARYVPAGGDFSEVEIDDFRRDDRFTGGMIAIILGFAFTVLLGLVAGAGIWTAFVVD